MENNKKTALFAAWCGSGKTHICAHTNINAVEIEYWKYKNKGFHEEYIKDVKNKIGVVDYIFISTDPHGLKLLKEQGLSITLVYPDNQLRNEYLDRYLDRDCPYEFIGTFMKHWDLWINELKNLNYCRHIILKRGEYLKDVLFT